MSLNCYWGSSSSNFVFLPGYILPLLSRAPPTASCADVPGAADYVLTPSDMNAINARMAQINTHIQAKASENARQKPVMPDGSPSDGPLARNLD